MRDFNAAEINGVPEKQKNLALADIKSVFVIIDSIANKVPTDRDVLVEVMKQSPIYEKDFMMWLVRHTLHPEADEDIMQDEVRRCSRKTTEQGYSLFEVIFKHIPASVKLYHLVKFHHQFWHVIELDTNNNTALLKPLNACTGSSE
ncbi:MAG: hypothetical protein JXA52_07340 [Planctomycetes bacterium]|nr:hypothetical protein [Planctomycetota bacterium]